MNSREEVDGEHLMARLQEIVPEVPLGSFS